MAYGKLQKDIFKNVSDALRDMERFGHSKHAAKLDGSVQEGIFSRSTAKAYARACNDFAHYVAETSPDGKYTPLEGCLGYARAYIAQMNEDARYSPYTVKATRSALAKLFQVNGKELGEVKARSRSDITRSRERTVISEKTGKEILNPSTRAGHFSEKNHAAEVGWALSTGMRRAEMEAVRGDQLHQREDGSFYIHVERGQAKGGRERDIPVIGDVELVRTLCDCAGNSKVFSKVPSAMDVHHYRHEYATRLYQSLARPVDTLKRSERFDCRGDKKGTSYDKQAMLLTSKALGHNRINIIAEHYLLLK